MLKKDRWISSIGLIISILPLILIIVMLKFLPEEISYEDILTGVEIIFPKNSYLWIGLFCVVPLTIIISARVLNKKGVMKRNFRIAVISAIVINIVYIASVSKMIFDQVRNVNIISDYDFMGTICCFISLFIALISNILPDLKPNMIFGIKNEKTLSNPEVWTRVNTTCGNAMMYFFLIIAIITVSAKGFWAVSILFLSVVAYYIWCYIYSNKVYEIVMKEGEKNGVSQEKN